VADYDIHEAEGSRQPTAAVRATLAVSEIGEWFGPTLGRLAAWLGQRAIPIVGPPYARYHRVGEARFEVEAGFPVGAPVEDDEEVAASSLPGGRHATTVHVGPYEGLGAAYEALEAWVAERGGVPAGDPWEIYESDPNAQPDPATWRTQVLMPFRLP
jgi:effector-binding domain-containing protein